MIIYTKITEQDIQEIEKAYGIIIYHNEPGGLGSGNSNYLLNTNKGQLLLSIMEEQSFDALQNITRLLPELKQKGFHTSELIPTTDGQSSITCQQKPAFIKTYLTGEVRFDLNEYELEQLGVNIGQLHQLSAPHYLPKQNYYELNPFDEAIGLNLDKEFEIWLLEQKNNFKNDLFDLPRGLVHGDIFCDNVLYNGNKLSAIIDFEVACHYYLIYDIGMALIGTCSKHNKLEVSKVKALLRGYENVRQLTCNEWLYLPMITEYAAVQIANWRFWKYCFRYPNTSKKNNHREMMQLAQFIQREKLFLFTMEKRN